jgi:hypothetical protein
MKRHHLFIAFLILFIGFTNSIGYVHDQSILIQENTFSDNYSDDYQPLDNSISGKYNSIFQDLFLEITIILCLYLSLNLLSLIRKRYINLIPIFYQSNYVDTPPLKKMQ